MYVATQHREDPNLFYVTPVNENGEANPDDTIAVNLANTEWWLGFDDLTRSAIEQAIADARQQVQDPKSKPEDAVQAPEQPRGREAFNSQFDSWSPSGFKASGGFGTRGAAWHSYSPSGWGGPGGWSIYGHPLTAQERQGMYVNNWRDAQGLPPSGGISYEDARRMVEETERNMQSASPQTQQSPGGSIRESIARKQQEQFGSVPDRLKPYL